MDTNSSLPCAKLQLSPCLQAPLGKNLHSLVFLHLVLSHVSEASRVSTSWCSPVLHMARVLRTSQRKNAVCLSTRRTSGGRLLD